MNQSWIRRKGSGRSGFTLVELLVVVSIIALLIAILLPSLKKARSNARRVTCNANIRSISQASITYATDDPQEQSIPVNYFANERTDIAATFFGFGGKAGVGSQGIGSSIYGPAFGMGPAQRPLNRILFKGGMPATPARPGPNGEKYKPLAELQLDVFVCPSDRSFPGFNEQGWKNSKLSSYDYYGTSYACNPFWVFDPLGDGEPNTLRSNAMYLRPLSRVPTPSNTIMYIENAGRFAHFADWPEYPGGQLTADCIPRQGSPYVAKGWHDTPWFFNVAFGDGHSSWIRIRSYGNATGNRQSSECGPQQQDSRCICVLIRGADWQIDTQPAAFIPSKKHVNFGNRFVQSAAGANTDWAVVP